MIELLRTSDHQEGWESHEVQTHDGASYGQCIVLGVGGIVRKVIHVLMSVVALVGWLLSPKLAVALAALLLAASLAIELARRCWPAVNRLLWRHLPTVFRDWELTRLLGSTWFSVSMFACLLLYGQDVGGTAVLFLAWGDPLAEIAGRTWGRPGKRKTMAGSIGCLAACLAAGAVGATLGGLHPGSALLGAVTATLVELWSPPPDDNLWIPLLSGLAIFGAQALLVR